MNELLSVLADAPKNTGPDFGKASPIGLVIVVILLICVFALVWSMNRHLKKLPETFDPQPPPTSGDDAEAGDENVVGAAKDEPSHEPGG